MKKKYSKEQFIDAYIFFYGGTKKRAREIYKEVSRSFVDALCGGYEAQCKLAFYCD